MSSPVVVSGALLATALVAECLTALGSFHHADAPASLRASGLALVALLSAETVRSEVCGARSAPITDWTARWQKPALTAMLVAVSALGEHHGGEGVRAADAVFAIVVVLGGIHLSLSGGADSYFKECPEAAKKTGCVLVTSFVGALMAYLSIRVLRASLVHSWEALDVTAQATNGAFNATGFETLGYASSSDAAVVGASLGGAAGLIASYFVVSRVDVARVVPQLRAAGALELVGAVLCVLSYADQARSMPVVFGEGACVDGPACSEAREARRTAFVNSPAAVLLLLAAANMALVHNTARPSAHWSVSAVELAAALAMLYALWDYSSFSGTRSEIDAVAMVQAGALALCAVGEVSLASFVAGMAELYGAVVEFGRSGYGALRSVFFALWFCAAIWRFVYSLSGGCLCGIGWSPRRVAVGALSGASLASALAMGAAVELASYDGGFSADYASDPSRAATHFLALRVLPLGTWIFALRDTLAWTDIPSRDAYVAWLLAPCAPLLLCLSAGGNFDVSAHASHIWISGVLACGAWFLWGGRVAEDDKARRGASAGKTDVSVPQRSPGAPAAH